MATTTNNIVNRAFLLLSNLFGIYPTTNASDNLGMTKTDRTVGIKIYQGNKMKTQIFASTTDSPTMIAATFAEKNPEYCDGNHRIWIDDFNLSNSGGHRFRFLMHNNQPVVRLIDPRVR